MGDQHWREAFVPDEDSGLLRTGFSPVPDTVEVDLLELVVAVEHKSVDELPLLYDEVGHPVDRPFQTPPSLDAQVVITFSYSWCRITKTRNGDV